MVAAALGLTVASAGCVGSFGVLVAVVAQLERSLVALAVSAAHRDTVCATPDVVFRSALAGLAERDVDVAIAALLVGAAVGGTSVAVQAVVVVADFARGAVDDAVAAAGGQTHVLVAGAMGHALVAAVRTLR